MKPVNLASWLQSGPVRIAFTAAVLLFLWYRVPLGRLGEALEQADASPFLAAMLPNAIFFFCWDTLVLTVVIRRFHGRVSYRELLPVRATSYVVALFNTNAARATLAAYLCQRLDVPFLHLGGTVLFLVLTEYLHLVAWATFGLWQLGSGAAGRLVWMPLVAAVTWLIVFTYTRAGHQHQPTAAKSSWVVAPRAWLLFRTFRVAPASAYLSVVLLRAPAFFVSASLHYAAAPAFGLDIPFAALIAFLPVIFMIAALPVTVAHLGTTQVAWLLLFGKYASAEDLVAFSVAAHLTFVVMRALIGVMFLPRAYTDVVQGPAPVAKSHAAVAAP